MPIARGPALVAFDDAASRGPRLESLTIVFERMERPPVQVLPFEEFTLQRTEAARAPAYSPDWTDFNPGDPGITLGEGPPADDFPF